MLIKEKAYLIFALSIQVIQVILILLFWNVPIKESVFLPELLILWISDYSSLQTEQVCALIIHLIAWLALAICLAGLRFIYCKKYLPRSVFAGISFCGLLMYAGLKKWLQTVGEFRLYVFFLKTDILALVLIGMFLAKKILSKRLDFAHNKDC